MLSEGPSPNWIEDKWSGVVERGLARSKVGRWGERWVGGRKVGRLGKGG